MLESPGRWYIHASTESGILANRNVIEVPAAEAESEWSVLLGREDYQEVYSAVAS